MQIYDDSKKRIGTLSGFRNRTITTTLDSGDKELSFEYPANGEMVDLLKEECYIRTKTDEFVLKAVEKSADYNKYTAQLNVEELEGQSFPYGFASEEQTIRACLEFTFDGTEWTVGTCAVAKKRTIDIEESTTAWDVLQQCLSTYRCECKIDSLNKKIHIYEAIGQDRGCYFVEGLNLRKLTLNSDTYEFYTRIFPIGKDGITIEWLHGKEYLENYQYSTKIKTYTWRDERYTDTTSLMEDAKAKLEEMSKPYKAYTADVVDLARANPEYSDVLDYDIGDSITLISKRTGTREKQRIVKIVKNPEQPEKNTVELSNRIKTFAEVQKTETELAKQEAISIANSTTKKILGNYSTTEEMETKITASKESIELGVMHTFDNYYNKTETDAAIKLSKGEIELGVSQIYQTKTAMGDYSTTKEVKSLIDITAEGIELEVSKKVGDNEIISKINQTAEKVAIKADKIDLNGAITANGKVKINEDGTMELEDAVFNGELHANGGIYLRSNAYNVDFKFVEMKFATEDNQIIFKDWTGSEFMRYTEQFGLYVNNVGMAQGSATKFTANSMYCTNEYVYTGVNLRKPDTQTEYRKILGSYHTTEDNQVRMYDFSGGLLLRSSEQESNYFYGNCKGISDARLKNIEKEIGEEYCEKLKEMKAVIFTWKNGIKKKHFGVIAQNIKEVLGDEFDIVSEVDGHLTVDYSELTPILIGVVKASLERIEKLESVVIKNENSD